MANIIIMGAGLIGYRHVALVSQHPLCHLVGVVEPDKSRQLDDGNRYFTSLEDIDEHVDGIIIATPTGLHLEHAKQAIARGWHMLIEKPVTATPQEAQELIPLVKEAGLQCLVGHHRRYHPSIQTLKSWVASGQFGKMIASSMIWAMKKPDSYFVNNWRATDGSPVMINTIHDIDLLRFVLGDITDMTGFASADIRGDNRVETAAVALAFASGAKGTIIISDSALSPWGFEAGTGENPNIGTTHQDMWWITGTNGSVSFPSLTRWGGASDWSQAAIPQITEIENIIPLRAQLDHFIAVIDNTQTPIITVEDASASLASTWQLETMLAEQLRAS